MICPDCGFDNFDGVEECATCTQPLVEFDSSGSELEQAIARHSIELLAQKSPCTLPGHASVKQAIREMVSRKIGCVLVEDRREVVGIFTERDVLNRVAGDDSHLQRPIRDFMTSAPATLQRSDSIAYALQLMDLGGYRHLPILDERRHPTAIISVRDILRYLCIRFGRIRAAG